jgi:hypothetical protein|tara:strand:+ start:46 stop:570 length:525 start_codon:yes stop_codon:yes gene_type:complete
MSNPTTPFSWQMPTATDLVTDLPADFEVFGQAVATSMADLLGGTSGQVLAKNSNTDMDFIWIAQDDTSLTINAQTGTSYTAVIADATNTLVTMDNASANTFNIPTDASVNFDIGTVLNIYMKGAGVTTITATTPGTTTVVSAGLTIGSPVLARYKTASAIKLAANSWTVIGGIA